MDEAEKTKDPAIIVGYADEGAESYAMRGFLHIEGHEPIEVHDVRMTLKDRGDTLPLEPHCSSGSVGFSFKARWTAHGRQLFKQLIHRFRVQRHFDN